MRIGCQINTWGKMDLPSILPEVKEAGYEGFEAAMPKIQEYMDDAKAFGEMIGRYGLVLSSVYVPGKWHIREEREKDLANCRKAAEFASALGCKQLIVGGSTMKPEDDEKAVLAETAMRYNEIGRIGKEYGLEVCVHPHAHPGATVASPAQIAEIMDTTDPELVFLCPDVGGHVVKGGGDAVEIHRVYADRIKYVHFKDIGADGEWRLLGEGITDYPTIVRLLRESGYDGWIIAEEECKPAIEKYGALECARRNCNYIRQLIS